MKSNKPLFTIFMIVFIDLFGFGLILPLLPFIAEQFKANAFQIGLLTSAFSLFQFISSPILGRLSDRYGRKRLLILSQLGSMAGYLLLGVAWTLPLLFLSRIIDGITGGNISIAQAYIADITNAKNRAKGMGMIGAAFGLGFILGPAIGGALSRFGFAAPAFFAAFISLVTMIATSLFLKETVDVATAKISPATKFSLVELKKVLRKKPLGMLVIVFFLINFAFSSFQGTFALWTQTTFNWGPTQIGYIFAYIGILAVIFQLKVLPFVVGKIGERKTLGIAIPLLATGIVLIPLSPHVNMLFLANGLIVFGNSLANPTISAIASENVTPTEYGEILGLVGSAGALGRIVGPALGGELFFSVNKDAPYFAAAALLFLAFLIVRKNLTNSSQVLA